MYSETGKQKNWILLSASCEEYWQWVQLLEEKWMWDDGSVLYWSPSVRSMVHILPLNHKCFLLTPWCLDCHRRPANWAVGLIFCESLTKHCTGWALASVLASKWWIDTNLSEENSAEVRHMYKLCLSKYIHSLGKRFAYLKTKTWLFLC